MTFLLIYLPLMSSHFPACDLSPQPSVTDENFSAATLPRHNLSPQPFVIDEISSASTLPACDLSRKTQTPVIDEDSSVAFMTFLPSLTSLIRILQQPLSLLVAFLLSLKSLTPQQALSPL